MSESRVRKDGLIELDTADVDHWVGKPLGGGQLKEPVQINDLRTIISNLGCPSLEVALEALGGPMISRKDLQAQETAVWDVVIEEASESLLALGCDSQAIKGLNKARALRRIARQDHDVARNLLAAAINVSERFMQLKEEMSRTCRPALAAEVLGDSELETPGERDRQQGQNEGRDDRGNQVRPVGRPCLLLDENPISQAQTGTDRVGLNEDRSECTAGLDRWELAGCRQQQHDG